LGHLYDLDGDLLKTEVLGGGQTVEAVDQLRAASTNDYERRPGARALLQEADVVSIEAAQARLEVGVDEDSRKRKVEKLALGLACV
jgi:hypothetical protein